MKAKERRLKNVSYQSQTFFVHKKKQEAVEVEGRANVSQSVVVIVHKLIIFDLNIKICTASQLAKSAALYSP